MAEPVILSDELILDARLVGEVAERSIAGQIEFWASLGRAIEPLLEGSRALALLRSGPTMPLSECLANVDTPEGRKRLRDYLNSRPYPHFEAVPGKSDHYVRIDEDGTRTIGRFVGRQFQAVP